MSTSRLLLARDAKEDRTAPIFFLPWATRTPIQSNLTPFLMAKLLQLLVSTASLHQAPTGRSLSLLLSSGPTPLTIKT